MYSKCLVCLAALLVCAAAYGATQKYRVEGRLMYLAPDGSVEPAPQVSAHVYDRDIPPDGDDFLAVALTGAEGKFSVEFTAEPYQDIYVRFICANSVWRVQNADGVTYEWDTLVFWDSASEGEECVVQTGTYVVGRGEAEKDAEQDEGVYESVGALWIFDAAREANDFCSAHGIALNAGGKEISLVWPSGADVTSSLDREVRVALKQAGHKDIIIHEIGHVLMSAYSRIPRGAGGRHRIDRAYNEALAWSEGWASFFTACVLYKDSETNPRLAHFGGGVSIETVPEDYAGGDRNEMRVAAALWDLYDVVQDGTDNVGMKFEDIWNVLAKSEGKSIGGFREYVSLLIRRSFTDEKVIRSIHDALANNGIRYELDTLLAARKP